MEEYWIVEVSTCGPLCATGTEDQAEHWCWHKTKFEKAKARYRPATAEEKKKYNFSDFAPLIYLLGCYHGKRLKNKPRSFRRIV